MFFDRDSEINEFCLDITDLLVYTKFHRQVSGIQRTQANIAFSILNNQLSAAPVEIMFVNFDHTTGQVNRLSDSLLKKFISLLRDSTASHDVVKACMAAMIAQASPWHASHRSAYIVTGAFWMFSNAPVLYNNLKRSGCIIGCLIYDLIPISHPEFCDETLVASFKTSIDSGLPFFDLILTISEYTAQQVGKYIDDTNSRSTIIIPVPLAHSIHDDPPSGDLMYPELQSATFNDYVLCVGTIEARKNHAYLFQVWKLLLESGAKSVPKLVIVGRWGWRVADLKSQLEACQHLYGHIVILSDIDDEVLEILYRKCRFTVLASFVEGWGLPVGESLAHGKFCIASSTSSIPEVGKNFIEYFDPFNARQGFVKILELISNPKIITQRENFIRNHFQQRTWAQVADDFVKAICAAIDHPSFVIGSSFEYIMVSTTFEAGLGNHLDGKLVQSGVTPLQAGWHVAEEFGRWMDGKKAQIRFKTGHPVTSTQVLVLELVFVPWIEPSKLVININKDEHQFDIETGGRFTFECELSDLNKGEVDCHLSYIGNISTINDVRGLSVGIERFHLLSR